MEIAVNLGFRPEANFKKALQLARKAGLNLVESDEDWRYARGTVADSDLEKLYRIQGLAVEPERQISALAM